MANGLHIATLETIELAIPEGSTYGDSDDKFRSFFGEELLREALERWHPTLLASMPRNKGGGFNKTFGGYHSVVKVLGYWVPHKNKDGSLHKSSRILTLLAKAGLQPPKSKEQANEMYHGVASSNPRLSGALRVYAAAMFFERKERDAGHLNAIFYCAGIKND